MVEYTVIFTPEVEIQLDELFQYIETISSPEIADRYTKGIITYCEELQTFPKRGTNRNDLHSGLRTTNYKKKTVIAFFVDANVVSIIGIYYGGQDIDTILS